MHSPRLLGGINGINVDAFFFEIFQDRQCDTFIFSKAFAESFFGIVTPTAGHQALLNNFFGGIKVNHGCQLKPFSMYLCQHPVSLLSSTWKTIEYKLLFRVYEIEDS